MGLTIKRFMDITLAATLLLLLSPLYLWLYLKVRRAMGAPVLFRQSRVGLNERLFTLFKFRTMANNNDASGEPMPDASRLNAFGSWLRASSLDELPEFWNILKGDMSFVGPRPLLVEYIPVYTARERLRHRMRPGLTGLAQISGRNALSWDERLELDVRYIEDWSLVQDFKIIWRTFRAVTGKSGINAEGHVTMPRLDHMRKGMTHATH